MDVERFCSMLQARKLTRREVNKALAVAGVSIIATPVLSPTARGETASHPTFFTWGSHTAPELYPQYSEKYGSLPNFSLYGSEDEALAKIQGGFQPDLSLTCVNVLKRWYDLGVIQPIDTSVLTNWPDVIDALKTIEGTVIEGKRYWVPRNWGQTSVAYRTDLAPEYVENESLAILWDEKYAGRLAMIDVVLDAVATAAAYAGIKDPFNMGDEEIETLREVLRRQHSLLRMYSADMTNTAQALASGELVAALVWSDAVVPLQKEGLPVKFMNPKEGAFTWVCGCVLNSQTQHYEKAHELIDALLEPRSCAWEMENLGYGTSNIKAFDLVGDDKLAELGLPRDPVPFLHGGIFALPLKNRQKIAKMFEEVKAGF